MMARLLLRSLIPVLLPLTAVPVPRLLPLRPLSAALALALGLLPATARSAEPPTVAAPPTAINSAAPTAAAPSTSPAETRLPQCPVGQPIKRDKTVSTDPAVTAINANADWTESRSPQEILLHDNVRIQQGSRQLSADHAALNNDTGQMQATGNVVLTDQSIEMRGSTMQADMTRNSATVRDSEYRLTDRGMHGSASEFTVREDGFITLQDATFTSCPEGDESWLLSASEMSLDRNEGWGEATNLSIDLFGVPAVYLPYMTFPIDERRRSGILMPTASYEEDNGIDIAVPYYWNIAEDYDATFFPRWIEARGFQLGTEFRYLTEASTGTLFGEVLPDDKDVIDGIDPDRWAYGIKHRSQFTDRWYGLIDASGVSDDRYFEDLGRNVSSANETTLPRTALVGYRDRHWQTSLQAYRAQMLQTPVASEPYRKLPELRFLGQYPRSLGGLGIALDGSATVFDHPDLTKPLADRVDVAPQIKWPMEALWGYLTPSVKYRYTEYALQDQLTDEQQSLSRELPIYAIDSGLFFEREGLAFDRHFVQTLEPRVYALYVPFEDQDAIPLFDTSEPTPSYNQLFRDNRFIGADRQGDARQISVGLTSRVLSADGGEEWLRLAVGQSYYQQDRKVSLTPGLPDESATRSPLYSEGALALNESVELRGLLVWNDIERNTVRGSFAIHYEPDERRVVNIEHRYREYPDRVAEQADLSFAFPLSTSWQMVGRWQHDLSEAMDIDSFVGFEYESCCWAMRLVARHYLNVQLDSEGNILPGSDDEYDDGVYFQFVFKGLGGAGSNSLRTLLSETIEGYDDRLTPR